LPDCPIKLEFVRAGTDKVSVAIVGGELSQIRPSVSYVFEAVARSRLRWLLRGPVIRTTLIGPDGDVIGPNLPSELTLPLGGQYIFSIASNMMAEGIYGQFMLEVRLLPAD
jgi:hypothetical protein